MVKCSECPYCKDTYPGKADYFGNHFCICGMTGNMVYSEPRKEKKYNGKGWMKFGVSSCGLFDTVEDVLKRMTESEKKRWRESHAIQAYEQMELTDFLEAGL